MNRSDEMRDQIRQMRYLMDEKKFIEDTLRKIDKQKNRLQVEDLSLSKIVTKQLNTNYALVSDVNKLQEQVLNSDYYSSGTPSRPIKVPRIGSGVESAHERESSAANAVTENLENLEIDVSKVLLTLASGGGQFCDQTEEKDDEN